MENKYSENSINVPVVIYEERISACGNCSCNVNFRDSCSFCPKKKWKQFLCKSTKNNMAPSIPSSKEKPPSILEMVKSATASAKNWTASGFQHTKEKTLTQRLEICHGCEFWNSKAFGNTGRCMKCGCSTWAKIRMATERCPIGKWGPETNSPSA
jgi:hypothetical protein